jgi:CheY-like chemotaxis protein
VTQTDGFIMVVDDDPDIRESLELLLRLHGHPVITAADGQEALQRLRGTGDRPCVILLDLMMPRMSGFELHDALSSDPALADIPIVVITGAVGLIGDRADSLSAEEVVRKPFELAALLAIVRRHCRPLIPPAPRTAGTTGGTGGTRLGRPPGRARPRRPGAQRRPRARSRQR